MADDVVHALLENQEDIAADVGADLSPNNQWIPLTGNSLA
jgi:hypothetical protein